MTNSQLSSRPRSCHPGPAVVIPDLIRDPAFASALSQHGLLHLRQPVIAEVHVVADKHGG